MSRLIHPVRAQMTELSFKLDIYPLFFDVFFVVVVVMQTHTHTHKQAADNCYVLQWPQLETKEGGLFGKLASHGDPLANSIPRAGTGRVFRDQTIPTASPY